MLYIKYIYILYYIYNMWNKSTTIDRWIKRNEERLHSIWKWMKNRCYCKTWWCYDKYWWVWIWINWKSFDDFKKDMFDSYKKHVKEYWEKDTTIDRIDVKWNYCKENCKWATIKEQWFNKTNNCFVFIDWQKIKYKLKVKKCFFLSYFMIKYYI